MTPASLRPPVPGAKILLTGGVRSGKSAAAEELLTGLENVCYVATGPIPDPEADPDWAARIHAHRQRRPGTWTTLETGDLGGALRSARGPVLVDCLGTWLTGVLDRLSAWDRPREAVESQLAAQRAELVDAWRTCPHTVVAVTNEVGWGVVSEHRSGRIFADELGRLNQAVASVSDRVLLVVAGRVVEL